MKRALCAILFSILVSSSCQAGYEGQITLASGSGNQGSLGNTLAGLGSVVVGTNLSAPIMSSFAGPNAGTTTALNGFFDFNTGAYTGTDSAGNALYAAGGNFFVLTGTLPVAAGSPPLASSLTTGIATVKSLGINTSAGDAEFELTMGFTGAYLSESVATFFGLTYTPLPPGRLYSGVLDFIYVNNSSLAGNQLLSGTISFDTPAIGPLTPAPEPSSVVMLLIGGAGVLGYSRRRLSRRSA
jgi:hypothetical protein